MKEAMKESMKAFERIIGYEQEKNELMQIADNLADSAPYTKLGVVPPKGLLLYGDPGVGKSLMAGCLIEASGRPAFTCRKAEPDGDFVRSIRATFEKAAEAAPSIVFLDDMDKFANEGEDCPDAEEYVTVQACIDEVKGRDVFVLATANNIHKLPESLRRAGRFDRSLRIENPSGNDAVSIIDHYLKTKKIADGINARDIARIMDNNSCAELETVINEAGLLAGYDRAETLTMRHIVEACLKTVYDIDLDLSADIDETDWKDPGNDLSRVICHEAGHATVHEVLFPGSVTMVVAGERYGERSGIVTYSHEKVCSGLELAKAHVISSLAGKAAVEIRTGSTDDGASDDLKTAFSTARRMIGDDAVRGLQLHDYNMRHNSEDLMSRQEQATADEVTEAYRTAVHLLTVNAEFFEKIASALAKKRVLLADDVRKIRESCRITPYRIAV